MARLFPMCMALSLSAAPAVAQPPTDPQSPWKVSELRTADRDFAMPEVRATGPQSRQGSRIFAGEEVMADGVIGFGMFGEKAEKSPHSPAVARELALPKQRKAAVGFSLKF